MELPLAWPQATPQLRTAFIALLEKFGTYSSAR
jgi:hypothetical protein